MAQVSCKTTLARSALLLAFVQAGLAIHFMPVRSAEQQNTGAEANTKTSDEASTNTSGQADTNTSAEASTNTSGQAAMNTSAEASTNTSGKAATNTSGKAAILPGELPIDLPAWYTTGKPTGHPTGKPTGHPTGKPWSFWGRRRSAHPTGKPWGTRSHPTGRPWRPIQRWLPWYSAEEPGHFQSAGAAAAGALLAGGRCDESDYQLLVTAPVDLEILEICKGDATDVTELGDLRVDPQVFDKCVTSNSNIKPGCASCFGQFFATEVDEKCWSCNRDHDPCGNDCMECSAAARMALANCTGITQTVHAPCWGPYGPAK